MLRMPALALIALSLGAPGSAQDVELTVDEQARIYQVLTERACDCGCEMTVAVCLVEDQTCKTSKQIAEGVLRELIASRSDEPSSSRPVARPSSDRGRWYREVAGQQLVYIHTSASYREKHCLWLYEDGSFESTSFGGSVSSLGSAAFGDGGGQGSWGVRGNVLTLVSPEGGRAEYSMAIEDELLYLDGNRYFRVELDNDTCR